MTILLAMIGVAVSAAIGIAVSLIIDSFRNRRRSRGAGISLLVPFLTDSAERERNWNWLARYYHDALPLAQIVVVANYDKPFRKTVAVNEAFARSTGDVIAILDADCYIDAETILEAARRIRADRRVSLVPYRKMYRLTEAATELVVESDPADPFRFTDPPPSGAWIAANGNSNSHHYGALIQILPREAFEAVRGMDARFQGWGGEDVSFLHSVDTLYGRHQSLDAPSYHLWHRTTSAGTGDAARQWGDQPRAVMNSRLTSRYGRAFNDVARMRALVEERSYDCGG